MAELHFDRKSLPPDDGRPWYADMTRYHWFVLMVAALGWLFDCLDQHLFTLARVPALRELLNLPQQAPEVKSWSGHVTMIFLLGWATGGLFFCVLGDRIGRCRALALTILTYALFTGLSFFAQAWWHLLIFRYLAALGIGGEWAVGASLL